MKELFKKLNFNRTAYILLGLFIVLIILNLLISGEARKQINNITGLDLNFLPEGRAQIPDFDYGESGFGPVSEESTINYVDLNEKAYNLEEVMPFYSEAFNVFFIDAEETFYVYQNPASQVTRTQIIEWFGSFPDIDDASLLNLQFIDVYTESEPPVSGQ